MKFTLDYMNTQLVTLAQASVGLIHPNIEAISITPDVDNNLLILEFYIDSNLDSVTFEALDLALSDIVSYFDLYNDFSEPFRAEVISDANFHDKKFAHLTRGFYLRYG